MRLLLTISILLISLCSFGQQGVIELTIKDSVDASDIPEVYVENLTTGTKHQTDTDGRFTTEALNYGTYKFKIFFTTYREQIVTVKLDKSRKKIKVALAPLHVMSSDVVIKHKRDSMMGVGIMSPVDGMMLTSSKKNELMFPRNIDANLSTNNSRQIFANVPGLNIWESDGAGIQLGIGGRGLSPNRTSNFNTRQNGYDISADALGYPETYYTPPLEAVDRIQLIRGAAGLQFGSQFGGMLNFVMNNGPKDKKIQLTSRTTGGSNALLNSFTSVGGTLKNFTYYAYFQYKEGDDWRPNSEFNVRSGHVNMQYRIGKTTTLSAEYTHMNYVAHQPGGLTDGQYLEDPYQSNRDRNWFGVDWNLASVSALHNFTESTRIETKFFGLVASRKALGFLGSITRVDPLTERDLIVGDYQNWGNETRFIHQHEVNELPWTLIVGTRVYHGMSYGRQGFGSDGVDADFRFNTPEALEISDYEFPSKNYAVFAEHLFNFSEKFSITPGVRVEHIDTRSSGSYMYQVLNGAGAVVFEEERTNNLENVRQIFLGGLGASYHPFEWMELYANFSQNYRSISFSDIQIQNPYFQIDPDLKDESGYNADIGFRGKVKNFALFDVSAFTLSYKDRIGILNQRDPVLFNTYQLRTNVADSRTYGIEGYGQVDLIKVLVSDTAKASVIVFGNIALIESYYYNSEETAIQGKRVELVPEVSFKTGLRIRMGKFSVSGQFSYTSDQYTDATNAEFTPNSVNGRIPAYYIFDVGGRVRWNKHIQIEMGVNNASNSIYFTRRAGGYPGPGIIPSSPRNAYLTLQLTF